MKLANEQQRSRWLAFVQAQPLPLDVSAQPWKATRSNEQNNWLWGVAYVPLVERTGYTAEEIHQYALGQHFGWVDKKVPKTPRNPEGIESMPRRTTTRDENGKRSVLDAKAFKAFTETVERIAAEAGCFIAEGWQQ